MSHQFIHLNLHTEFSLVDGIVRLKPMIKVVQDEQMPAIAITDQSNLYALVKVYQACLGAGIKPVLGADLWLKNDVEPAKPFRLLILCKNNEGYLNLKKLISQSYLHGQYLGKAIIEHNWLAEHSTGLIALIGKESDVGLLLLEEKVSEAEQALEFYKNQFPDSLYFELQRTSRSGDESFLHQAVALAQRLNLPVVATNAVRFLKKDDFSAHEARVCVNQGRVLGDKKRPRDYSEEQYFKSQSEMNDLFSDIPEALQNTLEIAKRCNVSLHLGENFLPDFPVPDGLSMDDYFRQLSHDGLNKRFVQLFGDTCLEENSSEELQDKIKEYRERLDIELDVIIQMGFPGYFLIVADFIRWSKENDVPVGPGRGSGAGSLVAYAMTITDLDPLEYDLLFERFLNPERVSMPDFDIDFCMDGRDKVIQYVAETYGRDRVSQIITFGSMAAKAAIRDVGRVQGQGYGFVDSLAKLIPMDIGITISQALEQEEELQRRYDTDEAVKDLIDMALALEGITKNVGKHAGGVVISPSDINDFSPVYCEEDSQSIVTQYDKNDVETVGLVKFDFLGLKTLTVIDWALKIINERKAKNSEAAIDIAQIDLTDRASFKTLKASDTTAVFQLESRGMKDLIKRLQPDCFEDIVALVALFRPGPLQSGMVDDFIDRKHGRQKVEYPHPSLEPILQPTYGTILYQEQVMQIAQVLAGYSLGGADILRRAMGKKKPEEMAKQREVFVQGAIKNGVSESRATYIFDLMEKFAGYGFNKSHSAAYALIAYQTAWLKSHYPAEFMAAVLSSDMDNTDKMVIFIEECRAMKLIVIKPNINLSQYKFAVNNSGEIIFGLGAIKGVGEAAIESILSVRVQKSFSNLFDFCKKVDLRKVNRRVLEALIKSGAMDEFGQSRAEMFASIDNASRAAEQHVQNIKHGQRDLFGNLLNAEELGNIEYIKTTPWNEKQQLQFEKETLGFYFSGHPLTQYTDELKYITTSELIKLNPRNESKVRVAGLVVALRLMNTKRGDRMAFISLADQNARIEVAVFADAYQQYRDLIVKDSLLVVDGEASVDDYSGGYKISATKIFTMTQMREICAKYLLIDFASDAACGNQDLSGEIKSLSNMLRPHRGGKCRVCIAYMKDNVRVLLPLDKNWQITPSDELLDGLRETFGDKVVRICY